MIFFSQDDIDTKRLFNDLVDIFHGRKVLRIQEESNTLIVLVDGDIRLSFSAYKYKLLSHAIDEEYIHLASVEDIGRMKLSAITGRASNKDYIDLYYILETLNF